MSRSALSRRPARTRWATRAVLGLAVSTALVGTTAGTAAAAPPPPAPALLDQGAQLLEAINSAVAEASTDPTLDLVSCLFVEVQTQVERFSTGRFDLGRAVDGFTSCFTAYAAAGDPGLVIPGPGVGEPVTKLPPSQVTNASFVAPAAGTYTSAFGTRWGATHYGIDIANRIGTPIVSVAPGTVISSGPATGFGLWVRVQHDDGTITIYGHNDSNAVSVGQRVRTNQTIAYIGNRGDSTGPHVHFEVRSPGSYVAVDPVPWLRTRGVTI